MARAEARALAYRVVLGEPAKRTKEQQIVHADLAALCRPFQPSFEGEDSHLTALREGRREVFLRMYAHMLDTEPTLNELLAPLGLQPETTPDD